MTELDKDVTLYLLGIVSGIALSLIAYELKAPTADDRVRDYAAYRACIKQSRCVMTPHDWIDYYDLKWRLEEKEIERTE